MEALMVLLIEDLEPEVERIRDIFDFLPEIELVVVPGMSAALKYLRDKTPDLILSDLLLQDSDVGTTIRYLRSFHPLCPTVLITGHWLELGGDESLVIVEKKGLTRQVLLRAIAVAVKKFLEPLVRQQKNLTVWDAAARH